MHAIRIEHVRKSYDGRTVLDDLELEIDVGEIFALLGPNGAGKTTTVEILEGHRRPDAGRVEVLGTDPATGNAAFRRRIGIVPQETAAFERATVGETVQMFTALYEHPLTVAQAIESVELDTQRDQVVDTLSGGQRRRLDVACGLVGQPDVLFLDEPTTGLDPEARRQMWGLIKAQRERGVTVLLTTHALDEAEFLADRIGVLLGGRLADVADTASIGGRDGAPCMVRYAGGDGNIVSISTHTPAAVIADLLVEHGGEPPMLTVHTPSLEDVYLDMVRSHTPAGVAS